MAFHDDLLQQAIQLINKEPKNPKQASLRRALSTAYYALFHLLINESVSNWRKADLRAALGRAFDHNTMKSASNRVLDSRLFPSLEKTRSSFPALEQLQERSPSCRRNDTLQTTTILPSGLEPMR